MFTRENVGKLQRGHGRTPRHDHLVDLACIQAGGPASGSVRHADHRRAAQGVDGILWTTAWRLAWAPRDHATCIA